MPAAAKGYFARGFIPVPVKPGDKAPIGKEWQKAKPTADDLPTLFGSAPTNIGLLLGAPSGGLIDIDLDCPEAILAAPLLLPHTDMVSGRISSPRSHQFYRVTTPPTKASAKYKDDGGKSLVELRSTGAQTIVPPSVHPTGEAVTWHADGEPALVQIADLARTVRQVAAAALLARHWPAVGSRHDLALALTGGLLLAGWAAEQAERFLSAVVTAAGDEEPDDRLKAVQTTAEKIEAGENVTGWPTAAELLTGDGAKAVALAREWLGIVPTLDGNTTTINDEPLTTAPKLVTTGLDTIDPEPLRWLVPDIIPSGKLTLFAGDGGHGKSSLTLALTAAVTTGKPAFGLTYDAPPPGDVLLVSCEDDYQDTIIPRLLAAHADLGRVRRVDGVRTQSGKLAPFSLAHFQAIEDELTKRPTVRLIIIDPAGAYVGGADDHKDSELRALLGPLAEVAARHDVSVILVKHLSKNTTARAVNRVMGSAGYVNAVRAAFLIVPDDKEDRRLFLRLKANLSPASVGFAFRPVQLPRGEADALLARFESLTAEDRDRLAGQLFRLSFLGHVNAEADDALAANDRKQRGPSRVEECAAWLEMFLRDGPRLSSDIDAEATRQGFTKDNVNKAKVALKAKGLHSSNRGGFGGCWASGFGHPAGWAVKLPHSHEPVPVTPENHENRENHDNGDAFISNASRSHDAPHSHEPVPVTPENHENHDNHDNGGDDTPSLDSPEPTPPTHTDDSRDSHDSFECQEPLMTTDTSTGGDGTEPSHPAHTHDSHGIHGSLECPETTHDNETPATVPAAGPGDIDL
jgi:hypothetical protein